jgi:Skp family chaperone for outer membrane proteins
MKRLFGMAFGAALFASPFSYAQTPPDAGTITPSIAPQSLSAFQSPVVAIDQQRLFNDSAFGKASLVALENNASTLQAEIRQIESDLEIEERLLTERRATLSSAEFAPLAAAFDDKVEGIRAAWIAKDRDLKRQRDMDQQQFLDQAFPILAEIMQEFGAVMLVDRDTVILSLDRADITQLAIDRLDARLTPPTDAAPTVAP